MQIGHEGINDFEATTSFPLIGSHRDIDYQTRFNSAEINFLARTPYPWKVFSGFRYVLFDEDFLDFTTLDKPIPAPADPPVVPAAFVDTGNNFLLKTDCLVSSWAAAATPSS